MQPDELETFLQADTWWDSRGHAWILYGIARALARQVGVRRALEIGVREGSTTVPLLAGLTAGNVEAQLVSVDVARGVDDEAAVKRARARVEAAGLAHAWELHIADSRTWASPHAEYGLIFIDGDHSYAAVKSDLARFAPLLARHGVLLLHDAETASEVRRALEELDAAEWLWTVLPFYCGLAVARRRADWEAKFEYVEDFKW